MIYSNKNTFIRHIVISIVLTVLIAYSEVYGQLTADLANGGAATASSNVVSGEPSNAFDNNFTSTWTASGGGTQSIVYDFGASANRVISAYSIYTSSGADAGDPRSWIFEGSNDGTSYTLLHTVNMQSLNAGENPYSFSNTDVYRFYRLSVGDTRASGVVEIEEIELFAVEDNVWLGATDPDMDGLGDWTEPTNWGAGYPQPEQNFTIDAVMTNVYPESNGDIVVMDLTITGVAPTLTINSGDSLAINGTGSGLERITNNGIVSISEILVQNVSEDFGGIGIEINALGGNPGLTTIVRYAASPPNTAELVPQYVTISPANNTGLNATLIFTYDDSNLGTNTESDLTFYRSTDNGTTYTEIGGTVNATNNTLTETGINAFSLWALGDANTFPVEWLTFNAFPFSSGVRLNWATASESQNSGFWIQHAHEKSGSSIFRNLSFVSGQGNSQQTHHYDHVVPNLFSGKHLFRLKQIDFNGDFSYSDVVEVFLDESADYQLILPNPFKAHSDRMKLFFQSDNSLVASIFDVSGKEVLKLFNGKGVSSQEIELSIDSSQLPSGVYILKIQANRTDSSHRFILINED